MYLRERGDVDRDAPSFVCRSSADDDKRLTVRAVQWLFEKYVEHAKIEPSKRHPHILRHSFATWMLYESRAPGGLVTVSKLLGHSSISTMQVYLSAGRRAQERAVLADPLSRKAARR